MTRLNNKVTVITGASRGVGRALAVGFAEEGAIVVAAARTQRPVPGGPEGSLEETVRRISEAGGRAVAISCDISDESQVRNLVEHALAEVGPIDVLINNAGMLLAGPIDKFEAAAWDKVMAVNLRGAFLMCKYVLPGMMERRNGNIVNITSRGAIWDAPENLAYGASRAALNRFTLNLALDMKAYNIAVNAFSPDNLESALNPADNPKDLWAGSGDQSGNVRLPPEEGVPPVVWLAQQNATTFTGRIVYRADFGNTWP